MADHDRLQAYATVGAFVVAVIAGGVSTYAVIEQHHLGQEQTELARTVAQDTRKGTGYAAQQTKIQELESRLNEANARAEKQRHKVDVKLNKAQLALEEAQAFLQSAPRLEPGADPAATAPVTVPTQLGPIPKNPNDFWVDDAVTQAIIPVHNAGKGPAFDVGLWIQDDCTSPRPTEDAIDPSEDYRVAEGTSKQLLYTISRSHSKRAFSEQKPVFVYLRYADQAAASLSQGSTLAWYSCIQLDPAPGATTPSTRWKTMVLKASVREKPRTQE